MIIIPATKEQIKEFCTVDKSVQAIAAVENGKVYGIAGVYICGNSQTVFTSLTEELKTRPRELIKAWAVLFAIINSRKLPTFAECDFAIPKAEKFLLHFGFLPYKNNIWRRD